MNIYAFLSLLSAGLCLFLGSYVYSKDTRNNQNRLFFFLCLTTAWTSFCEFGYRQAGDYVTATFWVKMAGLWPLPIAFMLHFALVFTEKTRRLKHKLTYFLIYAPAVVVLLRDLVHREAVLESWGWTYRVTQGSLVTMAASFWGVAVLTLSVLLCLSFYLKLKPGTRKQQAKYVLLGLSLPVAEVCLLELLLPLFGSRVPEMGSPAIAVGIAFLGYGVWRHRLFAVAPERVAETIFSLMSNLMFLVTPRGIISAVNQAALEILGYEEGELLDRPVEAIFSERGGPGDPGPVRPLGRLLGSDCNERQEKTPRFLFL